jgi:hypothetical protein
MMCLDRNPHIKFKMTAETVNVTVIFHQKTVLPTLDNWWRPFDELVLVYVRFSHNGSVYCEELTKAKDWALI